jgi:hypothetical protein
MAAIIEIVSGTLLPTTTTFVKQFCFHTGNEEAYFRDETVPTGFSA